jgi:four helix bundle protein
MKTTIYFMINAEFNETIRTRTEDLAVQTLLCMATIPYNTATKVMTHQLIKSVTSVGANFRAFCRGRSKNEKYAKIFIVVEEADETLYWLNLILRTGYLNSTEISPLQSEMLEILKISQTIKSALTPR